MHELACFYVVICLCVFLFKAYVYHAVLKDYILVYANVVLAVFGGLIFG
jgi:hypothetical protein